ncbi:MAG TPA: hypothetical protein VK361_09245, partial [Rubrobacteraceae bacterium]|nr:hypothetical protein [Rubrobacteraceae bacterium]
MTEGLPRYERNDNDDSVIFFLRNDVRASLRGDRETRASVTMWRGDDPSTLTAPDVGNILTANFRERLTRTAVSKFGADYDTETEAG